MPRSPAIACCLLAAVASFVAPLVSCSSPGASELASAETGTNARAGARGRASGSGSGSASAGEPVCFFRGPVTSSVRLAAEPIVEARGTVLRIEWDGAAPAGADWVPPKTVTGAHATFGLECSDPFDVIPASSVIEAKPAGARTLEVLLPASLMAGEGVARCRSHRFKLRLAVDVSDYAAPCRRLSGDGLPYDVLDIGLTIEASGKTTVGGFEGGAFIEG